MSRISKEGLVQKPNKCIQDPQKLWGKLSKSQKNSEKVQWKERTAPIHQIQKRNESKEVKLYFQNVCQTFYLHR